MKLIDTARDRMSGSTWVFIVMGLTCLLSLPSLWVGFQLDDNLQRLIMVKPDAFPEFFSNRWELFTFVDGNKETVQTLKDMGLFPWWTVEEFRVSFWRPLTVFTHHIDYYLWPDIPLLMHMHNILWFLALLFVLSKVYRDILGPGWTAGLALFLFAIDDAHGYPIGWIANRNAVIAAFLCCLALLIHHRWRENGWKAGAILAPSIFFLALLAGEAAVAGGAFLLSYAVYIDRSSFGKRLLSIVPYSVIGLVWYVFYHLGGFGTYGTGLYIDPGREFVSYLGAVVERVPMLLSAQFGGLPTSFYIFLDPAGITFYWIAALFFLFFLGLLIFPLLLKQRKTRFWFMAMVLSLLPVCATFPHERLLLFPGIAGMVLLSQIITGIVDKIDWVPTSKAWLRYSYVMIVLFSIIHIAIPMLTLPAAVYAPALFEGATVDFFNPLNDHDNLTGKTVVLVNPPMPYFAAFFPLTNALNDQSVPQTTRILGSGLTELTVTRLDSQTISIEASDGFLAAPMDNLFRGSAYPLSRDHIIKLKGLTIKVLELTPDSRPKKVTFAFSQSLDDPDFLWFEFRDFSLQPFSVPEIGETKVLPPTDLLEWLLS